MEKQNQVDLLFALIAGIVVFAALSISIVYFFILYKKRLYRKQAAMLRLESQHKEDLLFNSITSAEMERKRIAADIHDELGSIFVQLSHSMSQVESRNAMAGLQGSRALIDKGLDTVRRISHTIMPPELELYGLLFTLETFCEKLSDNGAGIEVLFQTSLQTWDAPPSTSLALYRIVQELTTNTFKHAGATGICIRLDADDAGYRLTYEDNGRGFHWPGRQPGMGFKNIESRVSMIGGSISYATCPGKGFGCEISVPKIHQP